jgi:hypothetical protein
MQIRSAILLTFFLSAGCISTMEEPGPMKFPTEPIRRARPAPELVPPAEHVTPTQRWKAELARVAPAGWTVGDAVDQLEAPDGWSRFEGGRGISFTISKKDQAFTIWFLPKDWKGKDDKTAPVKLFGSNADWQLFYTTAGHAGWAKPEEDVAKAFKVAFPARG